MLIRISLIIAIVAGLAAAALSFLPVKGNIEKIVGEREDFKKKYGAEQTAKNKALTDLKNTRESLNTTSNELVSTKSELQTQTTKATEQEHRATDLAEQLNRTKGERDRAQQELNQFAVIGVTADQVKTIISDLARTRREREVLTSENKVLNDKRKQLENELARYVGDDKPVALPAGLKGKIVAVDPKFDFVVLDIGANQGVLERGEMIVNRNGQLVAKVRVSSVQPTRSVANVIPEFKRGDIMEGDQVIY